MPRRRACAEHPVSDFLRNRFKSGPGAAEAQVSPGTTLPPAKDVMARTVVGLDIGSSGVRAAEFSLGRRTTLRKFAAVPLPEGGTRFYFEAARPDGAHDLMTSVSP
jgi:hypothetical protein